MELIESGKIHNGQIVLSQPLSLPEGVEITVRIEVAEKKVEAAPSDAALLDLPFFGMWADREEMRDSATWVRGERDKWQQRISPLD